MLGNIVHENIHRYDSRDIDKRADVMCLLFAPTNFGYPNGLAGYGFVPMNLTNLSMVEYQKIMSNSEFHAYTVESIMLILYLFFMYKYLKEEPFIVPTNLGGEAPSSERMQ